MNAFNDLRQTINEMIDSKIKPSVVRCLVKDVYWDSKTMTVTSLVDELEYYDILLGLGSFYRRPEVGSECLIGLFDGYSTAGFLIESGAFSEGVFYSGDSELQITDTGFIIKKGNESLKQILNDWIDEVSKIIVVQGTTINVANMTAIKQRLNSVLTE